MLPQPGSEFGDAGSRVAPNALQNVDQVVVGVDFVQAAAAAAVWRGGCLVSHVLRLAGTPLRHMPKHA